jgi:type VI secretion system protein VasD
VRVYELKSVAAFNGADFFALFDNEQATLSGELVGREEFQLQPSETRQYQRQLQPDTKFIGVVGAFRDLERARWRQAVPVPSKSKPSITIGLQARAVTVTVK